VATLEPRNHNFIIKLNPPLTLSGSRLVIQRRARHNTKQYQQVYYTYIVFFRNDRSMVNWLSVVKTRPRSHVEVVQDVNNEVITGDDVFQIDELVDVYRVAPSTNLEENLNFHVAENIFIDVDFEELNDVLKASRHTEVDEDDDIDEHQFNEEDYDICDNDEIEEEKDNSN
jgi:hypothetical protein